MKTSHYIFLLATACLTASVLFMGACTDEWDNHYEGEGQQSAADQPTLLELVKEDADLNQAEQTPFLILCLFLGNLKHSVIYRITRFQNQDTHQNQ